MTKRYFWRACAAGAAAMLATGMAGMVAAQASLLDRTGTQSAVVDGSLQVSSASATANHVTYSVTFRALHPLTAGSSTISLELPAHATLASPLCYPDNTDLVTDDASQSSGCGAISADGRQIVIKSPVTTSAGDAVTVMLNGITNPPGPGLKKVFVSTSSDPVPASLHFVLAPQTAVGPATFQLSSYSAAASRVTYSITFKSPDRFFDADNQRSTITLAAPPGTVFPAYSCGAYAFIDDTETTSGGCGPSFQLSREGATVTINPPTTQPGDVLTLVIRGVANTDKAGPHSLVLSTSADPTPVSLGFSLLPAQSVARPFAQMSSYAASTKAVTWSVGFSSPDRLSGFGSPSGDSTITLLAPKGTVFPPPSGCSPTYVFVDPIDEIDHCAVGVQLSDGGSRVVVRPLGGATTPGAVMALVVTGVTNPPSPGELRVWTTSDPAPISLRTSGPTVPAPSLQLDSTSARATMATYAATFDMRSGFDAANCFSGGSKLTLTGPAGTVFPAAGYAFYDLSNGTQAGAIACPPPKTTYHPGSTVPLATGIAAGSLSVKPGDYFAVVGTSVTSTASAGPHNLDVVASTGTGVAPRFVLTSPSRVSNPIVQLLSHAAGATQVHYAITFRAGNGLLPDASGIGLSMPGVAWGPGSGDNDGWAFYDDTTGLTAAALASYAGKPATPNKPDNPGPAFATPTTGDGFRAAPGDLVTVATDGTVNPMGPGTHTLTLYTSGDPAAVAIPVVLDRPVAPALAVLDLSSPATGAKNVAFALTFVSNGGLTANWSSISLDFTGFTWPAGVGDNGGFAVYDDTAVLAGGGYGSVNGKGNFAPAAGPAVATPSTGNGFDAAPGDVITVLVKPVVNAPGAGAHTVRFWTSADPVTAAASVVLS